MLTNPIIANEKEEAIISQNFEKAAKLRDEEINLKQKYKVNEPSIKDALGDIYMDAKYYNNCALGELDVNVKVTASGLQYKVIKEGTGIKPSVTDKVKVHYRGTLLDGTVFDSSYDRGQPIEFDLNKVIKGWTEGLQLMTIGSKYILYIPYDLAYGARGNGSIKPYSTLIFEVELLDVAKPAVNTIQGSKFQFPEYQRTIK